jgi:hypothetical protein
VAVGTPDPTPDADLIASADPGFINQKISDPTYEEWNRETGGRKLPERVGGKKKSVVGAGLSRAKSKKRRAPKKR